MKAYIELIFPILKAIVSIVVFLVGLGWTAYVSINTIVKAEGKEIRREVKNIRDIDMQHLDRRFDRLEVLIKEGK
jgi:hypothetical protein